jgi:hypothetical protein
MHTFKLNNMNTKHTPGPWCGKDGQIYSAQTGKTISLLSYFDKDEEQDKANQQLIAAAPELLEALQNLLDDIEYSQKDIPAGAIGQRQIRAARAAIQKAANQ